MEQIKLKRKDNDMADQTALVTGATKGIGWAITKALAAEGCEVILVARSADGLRNRQAHLQATYAGRAFPVYEAELSELEERKRLLNDLSLLGTPIDLLVNNAGIYLPGSMLKEKADNFPLMLQVNLLAPYDLIRGLVPAMIRRGKGHVFTICSVAARTPQEGSGSYSATKFGLLGLTKALRSELLHTGVSVTAVLPGQTWSATWEGADVPHDRIMQPENIADAVVSAWKLAPSAVVEEIVLRPQEGDL